ncbi:MAG: DUF1905 domain-containing protein [Ardenticatenales bacterium]|nr:DUF1905 domain-containing protein [Ardenticatenales bacterium]
MQVEFSGHIFQWRGPAPYYFVSVPQEQSEALKGISRAVTYGWGMIPVTVQIGDTVWKTSLWPKDGRYLVPLKDKVRRAEQLADGDMVTIQLEAR